MNQLQKANSLTHQQTWLKLIYQDRQKKLRDRLSISHIEITSDLHKALGKPDRLYGMTVKVRSIDSDYEIKVLSGTQKLPSIQT